MDFALQPVAAQNAHRACYCLVAVFQSLDQLRLQSNMETGQKRLLYSKILHCRYIYDSCFAIFELVLIYNDRFPLLDQ